MLERHAKALKLHIKTGYKKGVIRIWQKMAEYSPASDIKKLYKDIQILMLTSMIQCFLTAMVSAILYGMGNEDNIMML